MCHNLKIVLVSKKTNSALLSKKDHQILKLNVGISIVNLKHFQSLFSILLFQKELPWSCLNIKCADINHYCSWETSADLTIHDTELGMNSMVAQYLGMFYDLSFLLKDVKTKEIIETVQQPQFLEF